MRASAVIILLLSELLVFVFVIGARIEQSRVQRQFTQSVDNLEISNGY